LLRYLRLAFLKQVINGFNRLLCYYRACFAICCVGLAVIGYGYINFGYLLLVGFNNCRFLSIGLGRCYLQALAYLQAGCQQRWWRFDLASRCCCFGCHLQQQAGHSVHCQKVRIAFLLVCYSRQYSYWMGQELQTGCWLPYRRLLICYRYLPAAVVPKRCCFALLQLVLRCLFV
jgi:hypothetical protein